MGMETYIRSKLVCDLTKQETEECSFLTMGHRGIMQHVLHATRLQDRAPRDMLRGDWRKEGRAVMIREREGAQIVAWALITYQYRYEKVPARLRKGERGHLRRRVAHSVAYFYVRKDYRRRGLGRRLYCHLQRFAPGASCCPCNRVNRAFFRALDVPC